MDASERLRVWLSGTVFSALGVLAFVELWRWVIVPTFAGKSAMPLVAVAAFAFVMGLFLLAGIALARIFHPTDPPPDETQNTSFPSRQTVWVGLWLIATSVAFSVAMIMLIAARPPVTAAKDFSPVAAALYTVLAAGVGASVLALSSFSQHACEDCRYPKSSDGWYVTRPFLGALLGLLFFFLMNTTAGPTTTEAAVKTAGATTTGTVISVVKTPPSYLLFGLVGGLVGMFSKPATEKLRELFNTLFQTQARAAEAGQPKTPQAPADGNPQNAAHDSTARPGKADATPGSRPRSK